MIKKCIICGAEFDGRGKTCSGTCSFKRRRETQRNFVLKSGKLTLLNKTCEICGQAFETYYEIKKTCSKKCAEQLRDKYVLNYCNENREEINEKRRKRYALETELSKNKKDNQVKCTCKICGSEFEVEGTRRSICEECQVKKRREYNTNYIREKRRKNKMQLL